MLLLSCGEKIVKYEIQTIQAWVPVLYIDVRCGTQHCVFAFHVTLMCEVAPFPVMLLDDYYPRAI